MTRETTDPAEAGTREAGRHHRGADRTGGPRYRFAAPIAVSREDIADAIAAHVAFRLFKWNTGTTLSGVRLAVGDAFERADADAKAERRAFTQYVKRTADTLAAALAESLQLSDGLTLTFDDSSSVTYTNPDVRPPRPSSRRRGVQVAAQLEGR